MSHFVSAFLGATTRKVQIRLRGFFEKRMKNKSAAYFFADIVGIFLMVSFFLGVIFLGFMINDKHR